MVVDTRTSLSEDKMKVNDRQFELEGGRKVDFKATVIDILKNMPSGHGVDAARQQITLAEKLEACNGEMDLTPEDAVLIRGLLNRSNHLPPVIQVKMYDAFDQT